MTALVRQLAGLRRHLALLADTVAALDAPRTDEADAGAFVAAIRQSATVIARVRAAALRGDRAQMQSALDEGKGPALRAGVLASKLGLTACAAGL